MRTLKRLGASAFIIALLILPAIVAASGSYIVKPDAQTESQLNNLGDGKCVWLGYGTCASWAKSDESNCAWEPCCGMHMNGYPELEYRYQFKKACLNGTSPNGDYEWEKQDKNLCKGSNFVCCCPTAPTTAAAGVGDDSSSKQTLFKAPDLQIDIPGINSLSNMSCTYGEKCEIPWIGQYIAAIYNYGLSVAGIIAAIVLMAGGVYWLVSGGDASRIGQAKELIIGAVTGIILLVATYLILVQVNPNLIKMKGVSVVAIEDTEPESTEGNPDNSTACNGCVTLNSAIPFKNGRQLNKGLNDKLYAAKQTSGNISWRVTEAYPPSSQHKSKCHYNGMCVDIGLNGEKKSCADIEAIIKALQGAGLKVLNEYTGCGGTKTTYSTGGHLHVQ